MNQRKKYISNFIAMIVIMLSVSIADQLYATHFVGADMTFTCIGQETYEIQLTVRRDCFNGDPEAIFEDPAYVGIFDTYGTPLDWLGSLGAVRMELLSVEDIDAYDGICADDNGAICVSEARYRGVVYLPFRRKGYILSYQRCCRNVTLSNVVAPLETGNTAFVCITEETLNTCNSSPKFGDWPAVITCVGEPLAFDASAVDAEGDSLAYTLYTPHTGGSQVVPAPIPPKGPPYDELEWAPGFSQDNMLGSGVPLTINNRTGLIQATPGAVGQYLVGILVEEWRDGKEISKTRRNFEYNVIVCDGTGLVSFNAPEVQCDGLEVNFENTSVDQSGSFIWNFNFPQEDPEFSSTELSPTFTFPAPGTYVVQLLQTDPNPDSCILQTFKNVSVFESELSSSFIVGDLACDGDQLTVNLTSTSTEPDPLFEIESEVFELRTDSDTFMLSNGENTITIPCTDTLEIFLTVTSSNGCTSTSFQGFGDDDISDVSDISLDFLSDTLTICEGSSTELIGEPDESLSYVWSPSESLDLSNPADPIASPTETTTYSVEATDGNKDFTGEITVVVIPNELPDDASSVFQVGELICVGNDLAINLSFDPNNVDTDLEILEVSYEVNDGVQLRTFSGADINETINCTDTLEISILVTFSNGCTERRTQSFGDDEILDISDLGVEFISDTITICAGDSTPLLSSTNPELTFEWSPEEGLDLSDPTFPIASPESTTTYTLEVSDGSITLIGVVTVEVLGEKLDLAIEDNSEACAAVAIFSAVNNTDGSPEVSFEWSLDPDFSTIAGTGNMIEVDLADAASTIYLRGQADGFCESDVVSLSINPGAFGISADVSSFDTCDPNADNSVTVSSSFEGEVLMVMWVASDNIISPLDQPSVDLQLLEGQTEIILTYTATTSQGCTKTETITIPVAFNLDVAIVDNSGVCPSTAILMATSDGDPSTFEYEWSTDPDFNNIVATGENVEIPIEGEDITLYLRAQGATVCTVDIPSITVSREATGVSASFDDINTCVSSMGTVLVSTSDVDDPIEVVWEASDNITSDLNSAEITIEAFEGQTEIVLSYTATAASGCIKVETLTIQVFDELVVNIAGGPGVCSTESIYFATVNADPDLVTFEWSLNEDFTEIISTGDTLVADLEDGTTIYLRASTESCVSNTASEVFSTQPATVGEDAPSRICLGDTADVDLILPEGEDLIITWQEAPEIISELSGSEVIIVGMDTGAESVVLNYTITDGADCTINGTIEIPYSTVIPPNVTSEVQCGTYGLQLNIDSIYQNEDVLWDFGMINGTSVTSTMANPIIDFGMAGQFSGTLSSTMETCNFDSEEVVVEVPEILEITSDQDTDQRVCLGDSSVTVGASGNGNEITWIDQDGNVIGMGDSITVDSRLITTATAVISDTFGCSDSLVFMTGQYMFDITVDGPMSGEVLCSKDDVTLNITDNTGENLSYMWTSASGIISGGDTPNPVINPDNAQDLLLTITHNDLGCTTEIPYPLSAVEISASIDANPGTDINLGESVILTVNTDAVNPTFMWDDGDTQGTRTVTPTETTTYTVLVTDENGCTVEATTTINVMVNCTEDDLFIPSAFSPNNDNTNDELFVRLNGIQTMDFQIVDRWGKEVFRTTNQSEGWNGRHRQTGDELAPDVYAYCVLITCPDGSEFVKVGHVSIIR